MRSTFQLQAALLAFPLLALGQPKELRLDSPDGLTAHQARVDAVTFQGRAAIRLTAPGEENPVPNAPRRDHLALINGVEFSNGTLEVDVAGEPATGAPGAARGFVGIAFRVQPDRKTYDCIYLRPTNGRAEDQERRNHTVQYISHPEHTWPKLRERFPSRYEAYADIAPASWIRIRIVVEGVKARLFVNGAEQPTLIVNDVKTGASGKGAIALWIEGSTIGHFANLRVTPR